MDKLDFVKREFTDFEINISKEYCAMEIVNPHGKENIIVYYEAADDLVPYIVYFSYYHHHLASEEEVIKLINGIISGQTLAIEFFLCGMRRMGASINADDLVDLTYEKLGKVETFSWFFYEDSKLCEFADGFKVRGWFGDKDFDAVFDTDENGSTIIVTSAPESLN